MGNVGKDAEVRQAGGSTVASFTLATTDYYKDSKGQRAEKTEWHNIVWWNDSDFAKKYIKKGTSLLVEGKIATREYQDKNGQKKYITEIKASLVQFAGGKPKQENNNPNNDMPY